MAWSGFGQTHLVQKQAGVQQSSGSVSGRTQPARYQFPTFRLGSILPQSRWETRPDPIWFWLTACVRFWAKRILSRSKLCARIIRPASGHASEPIRIGSGMFTGIATCIADTIAACTTTLSSTRWSVAL